MSASEENINRVWALIKEIGIAQVVTHDGDPLSLWARPMAAHPDPGDNAHLFFDRRRLAQRRCGPPQQRRLPRLFRREATEIRVGDGPVPTCPMTGR